MDDDLVFRQLKLGPMENFSYVFGSRQAGEAAIVDPGFGSDTLLKAAEEEGLDVVAVVLTHSHHDHVSQLGEVLQATGAPVFGHPGSKAAVDHEVEDRVAQEIAGVRVEPVFTPGHCPDHVAYIVDDQALISGDALFIGECGRVDLPGSSVDAMYKTLMETFPSLDPKLEVYPGHDYGPAPHRSLAEELEKNYTLEKRDLDAFRVFMAEP